MSCRIAMVMAGLLAGCKPAPATSSPGGEARADVASAEAPSPPTARIAVSDSDLPPLPSDLVATLGTAHDLVRAHQRVPKPELSQPLATKAEHQAWVDAQLDPWKERVFETAKHLGQSGPSLPSDDADEAAWAATERARVVYSVLVATLYLDKGLVEARIPLPHEVRQHPGDLAAYQNYAAYTLGGALSTTEFWRSTCTHHPVDRPVPEDLAPWVGYCNAKADALFEAICAAEQDAGLTASIPCSGDRPPTQPRSPSDRTVMSMEQMMQRVEQAMVLCDLAQDVLDDPKLRPTQRAGAWRSRLDAEVHDPELLALVDQALGGDRGSAAEGLTHGIQSMLHGTWECEALPGLFDPAAPS